MFHFDEMRFSKAHNWTTFLPFLEHLQRKLSIFLYRAYSWAQKKLWDLKNKIFLQYSFKDKPTSYD